MRPPLLEPPTSAFLTFLVQVFMLFFLFVALLYGVKELALFAIIVLAMSVGSYLWSRVSLKRVQIKVMLNRTRLFPGGRLKIDIRATNSKLLPVLFKVDLFAPRGILGSDMHQWMSKETGLLWYQQSRFSMEFLPKKRGVYDLGPPMLRGGDFFGFFFKNAEADDRFEIVVYPRPAFVRAITLPKKEFFGIPGAQSPVQDPVFVFGTRDYQPGRPARGIHWKASARHNRLQEKLCEPAEQEKVLILLDVDQFDPEQAQEDFERILEVIASLILQMDHRGVGLGFATNGSIYGGRPRIIPILRSPWQAASILEALARVGVERAGPVTDILSRCYEIPRGTSSIYFAYHRCNQTRLAGTFMKHRGIPLRFIMVRKSMDAEIAEDRQKEDILYLGDILVPEDWKK